MKRILLGVVLGLVCISTSFAQQKVGYAKTEFIMANWSAVKDAETEIQNFQAQYQTRLSQKEKEIKGLEELYVTKKQSNSYANDTEGEQLDIQEIQAKTNDLKIALKKAEIAVEKKYKELLEPLVDSIFTVIEKVAKEKGYSIILSDMNQQNASYIVLYATDEDDITLFVLEALGVTITPEMREEVKDRKKE